MSTIENPLTRRSYSVGEIPKASLGVEPQRSTTRPLIAYSSVFGGLFIIAFVITNDFGIGRAAPVAVDRERAQGQYHETVVASARDGRKLHQVEATRRFKANAQKKAILLRSQQSNNSTRDPAELSIGILEGTFCKGAQRSTFCEQD